MFTRTKFIIILIGFLVIIGFTAVQSQDNQMCPAFVETAMAQLDDLCSGMERNTACYGYFRVGAILTDSANAGSFSQPSDQVALASLQTITTAPFDAIAEQWGIAVLNVQANVPNSLPGQAVKFILMGEAQVTNAVESEDVFTPVDPIALTTAVEANLRSNPTLNANIMAIVDYNTTLEADGISPDGEWLRVLHLSANMWVHQSTIHPVDTSTLPVIDEETRTPMQAFYFSTGLGNPQCMDAPDMLVVQGPNEVLVELNVNGVDIAVGSTVAFHNMHGRAQDLFTETEIRDRMGNIDMDTACSLMKVSVVSGAVELNQGGMLLPEGHTASSVFCDEAEDESPPAMMDWTNPQPMDETEQEQLKVLEKMPPQIMNYEVKVPTDEEIRNGPQPEIMMDDLEATDQQECVPQEGDDMGDPDRDGIPNVCDPDDDGDGLPDRLDMCPLQPGMRLNRGCPAVPISIVPLEIRECIAKLPRDVIMACVQDTNRDGIFDSISCPAEYADRLRAYCGIDEKDADPTCERQDNIGDPCNHDEDGDGILDPIDVCPFDARHDDIGDPCNHDEDGDGTLDPNDECPFDARNACNPDDTCVPQRGNDIDDPDGDGIPNVCDDDDDGDGIIDTRDECPLNRLHDNIGDPCNHDEDGDGILDPVDVCPFDRIHDNVGDPCNHDEDKDGIADNTDVCPFDSIHDNVGDPCNHDEDGDGIADNTDVCPFDRIHDNIGDPCNHDEDGDGTLDPVDVCPFDRIHDNVGDPCNHDEDGDGIADNTDVCPFDRIHDNVGDPCNHDEDRDGIADNSDVCPFDPIHDKVGDPCNHDEDKDGILDNVDICPFDPNNKCG